MPPKAIASSPSPSIASPAVASFATVKITSLPLAPTMLNLPPSSTLIVVPGQNLTTVPSEIVSITPLGTYTVLNTRWVFVASHVVFVSSRPPSTEIASFVLAAAKTASAQSRDLKRIGGSLSAQSGAVSIAAFAVNANAITSSRMLPIANDFAIKLLLPTAFDSFRMLSKIILPSLPCGAQLC